MQRPSCHALQLGFSLALSLAALPAQAQGKLPVPVPPPSIGDFPAPIQPTQPQALPPVLAPVNPPEANSGVAPVASDAAAKTAALTVPLLIAQWRTQKSTPQEAWDKGLLTVEDLIYILNHSIDYWGGFYWEKDIDLRREIVALLVQHGGDKIATPQTLSPFVRLWLADYYESLGDARTLSLCEGILSEIKAPVKGEGALAFQAIERIGWYHRDKGEYEQGAQAWLRMMNYHADVGWWTPDALVEAARLYQIMGSEQKAKELYGEVARYGNSHSTAMAQWDQADILIDQGKYPAAQQLLKKALTDVNDNPDRVGMLSLLGYCYYIAGEFGEAQKYCQESLSQYKALENPDEDIKANADMSEACLIWIEQWTKAPFLCEPEKLEATINQQSSPFKLQFAIRSHHAIPLTIINSNAKVKIQAEQILKRPLDDKDDTLNNYFAETQVIANIDFQTLRTSFDDKLIIRSSEFPQFKLEVPLHVEAQNPVHLSSQYVFFGIVKAGETSSTSLKISAATPFHILKVETDSPNLTALPEAISVTATEHDIVMKLSPHVANHFYQGQILISTDLPTQEVIEVPYVARME